MWIRYFIMSKEPWRLSARLIVFLATEVAESKEKLDGWPSKWSQEIEMKQDISIAMGDINTA